jgi:hypothetical protein
MDNSTDIMSDDENNHISYDSGNCDQTSPQSHVEFLQRKEPTLSFLDQLTGKVDVDEDVPEKEGLFSLIINAFSKNFNFLFFC